MHEPGSRETALVTEGGVRLVCDGEAYDLGEGDAVTFDADLPHHFENPGAEPARFHAVVTAGLRRS
jgi:mannose-6-phosphate isomerase-like protein (cupin superfamily)